jgi:hypothetical protein
VHVYLHEEWQHGIQELHQRQQEGDLKDNDAFRLDYVVEWFDFQLYLLNPITVTVRGGLPPRYTKAMRGMYDDGECRRSAQEMAGNR